MSSQDRVGQTWTIAGLGTFVVVGQPRLSVKHPMLENAWIHPAVWLDSGKETNISEKVKGPGWEAYHTRIT